MLGEKFDLIGEAILFHNTCCCCCCCCLHSRHFCQQQQQRISSHLRANTRPHSKSNELSEKSFKPGTSSNKRSSIIINQNQNQNRKKFIKVIITIKVGTLSQSSEPSMKTSRRDSSRLLLHGGLGATSTSHFQK